MGLRGYAKPVTCRCESNFTCGVCLANAKPWHWTPLTLAEQIEASNERFKKEITS